MRVRNAVADDYERGLALLRCGIQYVRDLAVFPHGNHGDNALVGLGHAHEIELSPVGVGDRDPGLPRFGRDEAEGLVRLTLGYEDLVYGAACPQSLDNCVAALYYIVSYLFFVCFHITR